MERSCSTVDSISRHLLYYGTPSNNHKVYVTLWKPQSIDQLNLIMCTREFIYFKYRTNCLIVVHCIDSVYVHFWNVSVQFIVLYDIVFDTSSFSYTRLYRFTFTCFSVERIIMYFINKMSMKCSISCQFSTKITRKCIGTE